MGGSSSNNNGSSTSRMKTEYEIEAEKQAKERQKMALSGVQDPKDFTRLTENLQAQKLEREAETKNFLGKTRGDDINIGGIKVSPSSLIPGGIFLNKMQEFAYKQQAKELRRGGSIVRDSDGDYVGVMRDGRYSGRPDFDPNRQAESGQSTTNIISNVTSEVTPEVTPEVVEDDQTITTRYATRRTKRSGQAGTIMEGYGIISRPKSKRAVT